MDKDFKSILFDERKCVGCINCMRKCPTQAIRVRNGKASINYERCIHCGVCARACPSHALYLNYDRYDAIEKFRYKVALMPSCMYGQYPQIHDPALVLNSLRNIGFDDVFEVARAADILSVLKREMFIMRDINTPVISNVCPACVELIASRYHSLADNIINLLPPVVLAAKMAMDEAKKKTGLSDGDIGIFYISPCPAQVTAIKNGYYSQVSEIAGALSVQETCKRLSSINIEYVQRTDEIKASNLGIAWDTSGGESANIPRISQLAVDGVENVMSVLREVDDGKLKDIDFIELQACHGGCVGGLLNIKNPFVAKSKIHSMRKTVLLNKTNSTDKPDKPQSYYKRQWQYELKNAYRLDADYKKAVEKMKAVEELTATLPKLDCGLCGSPTCRAFAEDVVLGLVDKKACVPLAKNSSCACEKGGCESANCALHKTKTVE